MLDKNKKCAPGTEYINGSCISLNGLVAMAESYNNEYPDKKINLNKLAQKTESLTGSDIEFICRKAAMLAIRSLIDQENGKSSEPNSEIIIQADHFEEAIGLVLKQNATKK